MSVTSDVAGTNESSSTSSPASSGNHQTRVNELVKELLKEKLSLEKTGGHSYSRKLLALEIERLQNGGRMPSKEDKRPVDVIKEKPIRVTVKIIVPVRDHPKFNFVGKLLGPKGNSLKRLQEETMTKMAILGKGSMRDKKKEEELRTTCDPRYSHLHEDLHVEVTAFAPPAEAHARVAYALTQIRRFLIPDYNDDIRQEQMREMQLLSVPAVGSEQKQVNGVGCSRFQSQPAESAAAAVQFAKHQHQQHAIQGVLDAALGADDVVMAAAAAAATATDLPEQGDILHAATTADQVLSWMQNGVRGIQQMTQQQQQPQAQQHPALRGLSGKQLEGVLLTPGERGGGMGSILTRLQAAGGIQNLHSTPLFPTGPTSPAVLSLLGKSTRLSSLQSTAARNGFHHQQPGFGSELTADPAALGSMDPSNGYHLPGLALFNGYGNFPLLHQLSNPLANPAELPAEWDFHSTADLSPPAQSTGNGGKSAGNFRNFKSSDRNRFRSEPYPSVRNSGKNLTPSAN